MFYLTDQVENAYIKSLDSIQLLKYISDFYRVSILTLIFELLWVPGSIKKSPIFFEEDDPHPFC